MYNEVLNVPFNIDMSKDLLNMSLRLMLLSSESSFKAKSIVKAEEQRSPSSLHLSFRSPLQARVMTVRRGTLDFLPTDRVGVGLKLVEDPSGQRSALPFASRKWSSSSQPNTRGGRRAAFNVTECKRTEVNRALGAQPNMLLVNYTR
ncbi:hypothetical protein RJT34_14112 [Clitoria ternatea]|uniref:Uncharacterized protein n=1 Tax=Clitoria ternatea TaxID=43366 RepID=A0AAN9JPS7_CLITE